MERLLTLDESCFLAGMSRSGYYRLDDPPRTECRGRQVFVSYNDAEAWFDQHGSYPWWVEDLDAADEVIAEVEAEANSGPDGGYDSYPWWVEQRIALRAKA